MSREYLPLWDGRFWDRRPIVVKIEDMTDFMRKNGLHIQRATWPEESINPIVEVMAMEQTDESGGER